MSSKYYSVMIDVPYFEGWDCIKIDYPEIGDYYEKMGFLEKCEDIRDGAHKKIIYQKIPVASITLIEEAIEKENG